MRHGRLSQPQLVFALVCRSQRFTLPQLGLFSNVWLFWAVAASALLQITILTVPFARSVFGVVEPQAMPWLMIVGLSLAPATVIELTKIIFHVGEAVLEPDGAK